MNHHKRRIVAFIAARLVRGNCSNLVYDHAASACTHLTGEVSASVISLFDHDRSDYIIGHNFGERAFHLSDLATGKSIRLELRGAEFEGYDHETAMPFAGQVDGECVFLRDRADGSTCRYTV